jgi:Flp pilus assembly protein TadB
MLDFPEISDTEWEKLTPEQQDSYNNKIELQNEYFEARDAYYNLMSLKGPAILFIIGIILFFIWIIAVSFVVVAILWAFYRVIGRSHAYQRYKDAESDLKSALSEDYN